MVEGRDVRDWPLTQLRQRIGVVPQKTELFTGTIADNLRWGNRDATEDLLYAARLAQAAEFIERLPKGLDSPVEREAPIFPADKDSGWPLRAPLSENLGF